VGNPTGFLEFRRVEIGHQPVEERIKDWHEFDYPLAESVLTEQAARCMDCGIPFCHSSGCPVENRIPEFNDLVYRGRWHEASQNLHSTNNFPEMTGRVCPAPCEAACTLAINDDPVNIKHIELQIVERAFAEGWVEPIRSKTKTGWPRWSPRGWPSSRASRWAGTSRPPISAARSTRSCSPWGPNSRGH